eukprot:TRINITY_DN2757_c1_g5_i1.p1 TRINITY_DN2757_c1_g5~~TRINITY_DN2757_c1_g5_i1.p1  ORF type:complete len:357 (+),score=107.27 TRINITY_DN2757_c1_g5_i1:196-1266(+)
MSGIVYQTEDEGSDDGRTDIEADDYLDHPPQVPAKTAEVSRENFQRARALFQSIDKKARTENFRSGSYKSNLTTNRQDSPDQHYDVLTLTYDIKESEVALLYSKHSEVQSQMNAVGKEQKKLQERAAEFEEILFGLMARIQKAQRIRQDSLTRAPNQKSPVKVNSANPIVSRSKESTLDSTDDESPSPMIHADLPVVVKKRAELVLTAEELRLCEESAPKLQALADQIDLGRNNIEIVNSKRYIVDDSLFKLITGKGKYIKRQILLFNDLMIVARPLSPSSKRSGASSPTGKRYRLEKFLVLQDTLVWDIADTSGVEHAFDCIQTSSNVRLTMVGRNDAHKDKWIEAINNQISRYA